MPSLLLLLFFLLLPTSFCQPPAIDETTTNTMYEDNNMVIKSLQNEDLITMKTVADIALARYNQYGLTSFSLAGNILDIALDEALYDRFRLEVENAGINSADLKLLDEYKLETGSLTITEDEYAINNTDPDGFDLGKVWDLDTIYNYINYMTSQVEWMEVMEIGRSYMNNSIQVVKVDRYPDSNWRTRRVYVFMAAWEGRDWLSIKALLSMLDMILKYRVDTYSGVHPLVTRNILYILPLPNPDGYQHTITKNRFWTKNMNPITAGDFSCVGVNLENNARTTTEDLDAQEDECGLNYAGVNAFEELEVKAVLNFTAELTANASALPIYWFQLHDLDREMLVAPFSKEVTTETLPEITYDVLKYFNEHSIDAYDVAYQVIYGVDEKYPVEDSDFLDVLIEVNKPFFQSFLLQLLIHIYNPSASLFL